MKPVVDADLCIGCGACEADCPEIFRLEADGVSHVIMQDPGEELYACVRDAMEACPTSAISIKQ